MTEFFLTGAINILNYGQTLPEPDLITTGDLRLPKTAEQYGTGFVKIKNAYVTQGETTYEVMHIDDGSGEIGIDDDSDDMEGYVAPPVGTLIDSITGWVYHHYGSYADSTTYKLEPLNENDIVVGQGAPRLSENTATPIPPKSSETVDVSIKIETMRTVTDAKVYYRVNEGAYSNITLTEGANNVWSGTIPAQSNADFVDYFYSATDDSGDVSTSPEDTSLSNYSYLVLDGDPTIHDIQYTPWSAGNSPLDGASVHFSGTVTANSMPLISEWDGTMGILPIQSGSGIWNSIFVLDNAYNLAGMYDEGETVEVWGTVMENYDNYYKWTYNTYVKLDSMKSTGTGTAVVTEVTLAELSANPEAYEGVLINIAETVTVSSINSYDMTISDGTNTYLLDDDMVPDSLFSISSGTNAIINGDTILVGNTLRDITGISIYSFASHKIEIRNTSDIGKVHTDVNYVQTLPTNYTLHQNYPNPFNPSTNISFDLPELSDVTVIVYNVRGQLVKVLSSNKQYNAGSHSIHWNGMDKYGKKISTGVYLCRIIANDFIDVKKMVYLK